MRSRIVKIRQYCGEQMGWLYTAVMRPLNTISVINGGKTQPLTSTYVNKLSLKALL